MDRASDSGSEGWGFESLPAYQGKIIRTLSQWEKGSDYFCFWDSNDKKGLSHECGETAPSAYQEPAFSEPPVSASAVSADCGGLYFSRIKLQSVSASALLM